MALRRARVAIIDPYAGSLTSHAGGEKSTYSIMWCSVICVKTRGARERRRRQPGKAAKGFLGVANWRRTRLNHHSGSGLRMVFSKRTAWLHCQTSSNE